MCPRTSIRDVSSAGRSAASFLIRYYLLLVASVIFLLSQRHTLAYFWEIWNIPGYYYSHGVIVPLLAAVMILMNAPRLKQAGMRGSWIGILIVGLAAVIQIIGLACGFDIVRGAAFLIMVYGALIALLGFEATKILFLPVLFLVTMIPLPEIVLDGGTARYQIASTAAAAKLLGIWDGSASHHGNIITADGLPGPLMVGVPCSGLKLLITLLMCTWFLSYVLEGGWWKKAALIGLSLPLSLVVNTIRVTLIGWVGLRTHSEASIRSFHDISGYIGLIICVVSVLGFARLMGMRYFRAFTVAEQAEEGRVRIGRKWPGVAAVALMLCVAVLSTFISGLYDLPKGRLQAQNIPASFGKWTGYDVVIDSYSRKLLDKADLLSRVYVSAVPGDQPIQVFLDAALDTSMFHDPRLCLPGAGARITDEHPITLGFAEPVKASLMRTEDETGHGLTIYWYASAAGSMPSKNDVNKYTLEARLGDLKQMALDPFSVSQVKKNIRNRQITWIRFYTSSPKTKPDAASLERFIADFHDKLPETVEFYGKVDPLVCSQGGTEHHENILLRVYPHFWCYECLRGLGFSL